MTHCLIVLREIFYFMIVLCLNILWLKAYIMITQPDCYVNIEYLITEIEIELALPSLLSPRPFTKL